MFLLFNSYSRNSKVRVNEYLLFGYYFKDVFHYYLIIIWMILLIYSRLISLLNEEKKTIYFKTLLSLHYILVLLFVIIFLCASKLQIWHHGNNSNPGQNFGIGPVFDGLIFLLMGHLFPLPFANSAKPFRYLEKEAMSKFRWQKKYYKNYQFLINFFVYSVKLIYLSGCPCKLQLKYFNVVKSAIL